MRNIKSVKSTRTHVIDAMKGKQLDSSKQKGAITNDMAAMVPFNAVMRNRLAYMNKAIEFWQNLMNADANDLPKWSDKVKASELMARYFGMFADEKPGDTYNTVILEGDARHLSEAELLHRLNAVRMSKGATLNVATVDVASVEGVAGVKTPTGETASSPDEGSS